MQIVFSSPVDPSTVNLNTVLLREGSINGAEIKISQFTANADNTVFTITTVSPLKPNTTYYLIFGDGIKTLSGDSINNTAFSFTTAGSSIVSPSVTIVSPSNNESNVPLNPFIKLQFSESVLNVAANVQIYNTQVGGSVVPFSLSMESNNLFVLNPSVQLNSGTKYYVVVGGGITNSAGSANLESAIYSFTTGDLVSPTVSISPSNNTNGVSIFRPQITLQFSNDMESSTINESSVQLWQNGTPVAITSITDSGNNTYVFSPLSNLTPGMVYQIVLSGQIADTNNNHLLPVVSSFSTANYLFSSSTAGTLNPGKNFILSYTYSNAGSIFEPASLTVNLPSGFTANSNSSYTCNFTQNNQTCDQEIHIDANTNIGSHQIQLSTSLGIALDPTYVSLLNGNYTYIVNSVSSGLQIERCSYDFSGIVSCSNSGAVINSPPYGISFSPNGKYGYVSVGGNGIYKCVVSAESGSLSNCGMELATSSFPANRDTAITSDGNYIYADLLGGNGIYGCNIESGTGNLFNCGNNYVDTTQLPNPVERIILNSDDSQLLVNAQGKVVQCSIGSNYQITNCTPQTTNIYGGDTLGLNFNLAYSKVFVAAGSSISVFQCAYSSVSGVDGNCASAWGTPFTISGAFRFTDLMFTPYNYVLIANNTGSSYGGLYQCNVDINGLIDGSSCVRTVSQSTVAEQVTVN